MSDDEEIEKCDTAHQESVTHDRYRAAVNHPVRKAILELLRGGSLTVEEIASKTGLTPEVFLGALPDIYEHNAECWPGRRLGAGVHVVLL